MQNRKNWKEKELYRRHISLGVLGHDVMLILQFQEHTSRNRKLDIGQLAMCIVQNSKKWRLAIHELYNGTYISLAPLQLTGAICLLRFRWEMPLKRDSKEDVAQLRETICRGVPSALPRGFVVPPKKASLGISVHLPVEVSLTGAAHSNPRMSSFQWRGCHA